MPSIAHYDYMYEIVSFADAVKVIDKDLADKTWKVIDLKINDTLKHCYLTIEIT
jgi:hypothetical protein